MSLQNTVGLEIFYLTTSLIADVSKSSLNKSCLLFQILQLLLPVVFVYLLRFSRYSVLFALTSGKNGALLRPRGIFLDSYTLEDGTINFLSKDFFIWKNIETTFTAEARVELVSGSCGVCRF